MKANAWIQMIVLMSGVLNAGIVEKSFGFPGSSKLKTETLPKLAGSLGGTRACTDFTGEWKGGCGGTSTDETSIAQVACSVIQIDNTVSIIGGMTADSVAGELDGKQMYISSSMLTGWNANQSKLDVKFAGTFQYDAHSVAAATNATIELDGAELVIKGSSAGQTFECRYHK
jgi:hypothetical protein